MRPQYTPKFLQRFWSKIDTTGECWLWTHQTQHTRLGYGRISTTRGGPDFLAHRVSWELAYGPIPDGLWVLHNCPGGDNPSCVRPTHLYLGTPRDNSRDMVQKGRSLRGDKHPSRLYPDRVARGDRHGSRTHPERLRRGDAHPLRQHPERAVRGEAMGRARLTTTAVCAIRQLYETGQWSHRQLAKQFSVTKSTIGRVLRGQTWRHVA